MDWKRLRILLKCITQSSLCPVVLANLGNQTALRLSAMCRLNYNHFQTGRTATESWSRSVRGTRCLRTTPETRSNPGMHTYLNFSQNGRSKSRFSNFKVVLNSIAITDSFLIYLTQCTWLSTCIKSTAFHYSYFCYLVNHILIDFICSFPYKKECNYFQIALLFVQSEACTFQI